MPPQQPQSGQSQKMFIDVSGMKGMSWSAQGDELDTSQGENPQLRNIGAPGQMVAGVYNPLRRFGYMCPSNGTAQAISYNTVVQTQAAEIRATYYDPTYQVIYLGENSGNIWINNTSSSDYAHWTNVDITSFWPISGTGVKITDITQYEIDGVAYMFASYQETGTGGDIAFWNLVAPASSATGTARLSGSASGGATLGKTNDHCLIPCDNGFMYILDGNQVHLFDGTSLTGGSSGTFTAGVLVANQGNVFRDGVDWNGSLWLVLVNAPIPRGNYQTSSGTTSGVYVWDRVTTSITENINFIPIQGVNDIIKIFVTESGNIRVLCLSSIGTTQIREYNGVVFEVVSETNGDSFPTYRDGVLTVGDMTYWLGQDIHLYAYGTIAPNFALGDQYGATYTEISSEAQQYVVGDLSTALLPSGTSPLINYAGAIAFVDNSAGTGYWRTSFLLSVSAQNDSGAVYQNGQWFMNGEGTIQGVSLKGSAGNVYTLVTQFPFLTKVNFVRVYHNQLPTSGTSQQGTFNIYLNQSTTPIKSIPILRNDIAQGYKYVNLGLGAKNGIISIQFEFVWETNIALTSGSDWMPRSIEIDYEMLPKKL